MSLLSFPVRTNVLSFTISLFSNLILFSAFALSTTSHADQLQSSNAESQSAFQGAYGYGAAHRNWRNAKIVVVDKLSDSNPPRRGELRYAVNVESGPRIVVFRTGGTIALTRTLVVGPKDANLYVAGQTAQGDGILIKPSNPRHASDIVRLDKTNNIVLRYIRIRPGKNNTPGRGDAVSIVSSTNIIVDHVSLSWSNDENLGIWAKDGAPSKNITVQNSLIAEPLGPRSTNVLLTSRPNFSDRNNVIDIDLVDKVSIHRNVFANADQQAPLISSNNTLIANNLTYNWRKFAFGHVGGSRANYVSNFLVEGPASNGTNFNTYAHQTFTFKSSEPPANRYDENDPRTYYLPLASVHHSGNYRDYLSTEIADGHFDDWSEYVERVGLSNVYYRCDGSDWRCLTNNKRDTPLVDTSSAPYPVEPTTSQLRNDIVSMAGASRRLDCSGAWVSNRDTVDARIAHDITLKRSATRLPSPKVESEVGGFRPLKPGVACADTDRDGMPDQFETRFQLNSTAFDPFLDSDNDGATNIEEYLDGTNPVDSNDNDGGDNDGGDNDGGDNDGGDDGNGDDGNGDDGNGDNDGGDNDGGDNGNGDDGNGDNDGGDDGNGDNGSGDDGGGDDGSGDNGGGDNGGGPSAGGAFPGAYGYGANVRNWKNAKIVYVDRLSDSIPAQRGELRYALNKVSGPRIVVFKIGGTIDLKHTLLINKDDADVYIAGQTAPGGGITIRASDARRDLIRLNSTNNVVIRYLRLRLGKGPYPGTGDNISIIGSSNVLVDHVSMSWANDENLGMWTPYGQPMKNITIQNNLLAEPLLPHAANFLINSELNFDNRTNPYGTVDKIRDISIHRNIFTHATHRAPHLGSRNTLIANNLTYDWTYFSFGSVGKTQADYVNNFLIEGPSSTHYKFRVYAHQSFTFDEKDQPVDRYDESDPKVYYMPLASLYHSGNFRDYFNRDKSDGSFDEWSEYVERIGLSAIFYKCDGSDWRCLTNNRRDMPLQDTSNQPYPIEATTPSLRADLLSDAGASKRVNCRGDWVDTRDAIDRRLVANIVNRKKSSPKSHIDVGGYLRITPGTSCLDTDQDGLPNDFEARYGLNLSANDAFIDNDGDGYSNFEEYLNGTNPNQL